MTAWERSLTILIDYVDAGSKFVFGLGYEEHLFAFRVLPTIIFFSTLMSMLYYLGVMQFIVKMVAIVMQKTLGTSGAESLSAAANIFVGQTEAPLVISRMSPDDSVRNYGCFGRSFATIAGGVMAAFIGMGINASDLLRHLFITPAAIVICQDHATRSRRTRDQGDIKLDVEKNGDNLIHAAPMVQPMGSNGHQCCRYADRIHCYHLPCVTV